MEFIHSYIFRTPVFSFSDEINESLFREALYLSTPVFYDEYMKSLTDSVKDSKELKKLDISLYKYRTRASTRCTPFGLFAGLSIGKWDSHNNIILHSDINETLLRKTRLDMNVLCSIAKELEKKSFIKPYLKFSPNTSLYLVGDSYRYVEYYFTNNSRHHKINRVDFTPYLEYILHEAKGGLTHSQLTDLLIDAEVDPKEANDFINELIISQILINQFEPTLTGKEYIDVLLCNLREIFSLNKCDQLESLFNLLSKIDELIKRNDLNVVNPVTSYKYIYEQLKLILSELSEINLFQTDLYKKTLSNSLNKEIQNQLLNAIQFLNRITPTTVNGTLEGFKKRFLERYEDRAIPLLLALDAETGVGYPAKDINGINDLIEDVFAQSNKSSVEIKFNALELHLLKLLTDSAKNNKKIIEINEIDFDNVNYSNDLLPPSFSILFKVLNSTVSRIEMKGIVGSSAINLLGRFANGNEELSEIVKSISNFEQQQMPNKILAEIIHLPESRTGNILARSNFREYEIPYLAGSSVNTDFQIRMEDLTISIRDNKVILFDNRLNKEIIPRLGNSHNFRYNSLPVYHFLGDLQTQYFSKYFLGFNWGILSNQFNFLPRVEYKNIILSPARWQLNKNDLECFHEKKADSEKLKMFYDLKERCDLPDKFSIIDGDNELLIDCNILTAVDTFIDIVKNRYSLILDEYLFEKDDVLIKDSNSKIYTNEFIAIVLNDNLPKEQPSVKFPKTFNSREFFSVGSEWIYYKIYCGTKTIDYILINKIKRITENLFNQNVIDKYFFIRYADPETHLRFRLHISDLSKYSEVLQLINSEFELLINQNIVSKIQIDTYKRELNRYGDNTIELAEKLFHNDSVFVISFLSHLNSQNGGVIRWQMAIRSVDAFLNDFKLTKEEKYLLIDSLRKYFFTEHGGTKELKLVLDNKFRNLRQQIEIALADNKDGSNDYYPIVELINARSKSNKEVIENIDLLEFNSQLQLRKNELISSLLHMNINRIFMGRNRTNEFVLYDLLCRYYKSDLARLKRKVGSL